MSEQYHSLPDGTRYVTICRNEQGEPIKSTTIYHPNSLGALMLDGNFVPDRLKRELVKTKSE